jgi:hypothetical protein
MKYLDNFFNYIKESKEIDKDEVESMLLPLRDLGFTPSLVDGTIVGVDPSDKNHGKKYLTITIPLNLLKTSDVITTYRSKHIDDDRIWELFDEILALRGRMLDSGLDNCLINFSNRRESGYMSFISLTLIGDKDESGGIKLVEFESRIKSVLNSMKSDFGYNTYTRLYDDHILIKSPGYSYTERKFNNLLNRSIEGSDLKLSDFNIEKTRDTGRHPQDWLIKITIKE